MQCLDIIKALQTWLGTEETIYDLVNTKFTIASMSNQSELKS